MELIANSTTNDATHPLLSVITTPLTDEQEARLYHLVSKEIVNALLKDGVCIAGGAVVYVLNETVEQWTVGDVDFFVPNTNADLTKACARIVDEILPAPKHYLRQRATVKIHARGYLPVQIIHSPGSAADIIKSFDIDCVQCAIIRSDDGVLWSMRTGMCELARETKIIRYLLDYPYNGLRLSSRLTKAARKGFKLPGGYKDIGDLDVALFVRDDPYNRHDKTSRRETEREIKSRYIISGPKIKDVRTLEDRFDGPIEVTRNTTVYENLQRTLEPEFSPFNRDDYDGEVADDGTVTIKEHMRLTEGQPSAKQPRYVRLFALPGFGKEEEDQELPLDIRQGKPPADPLIERIVKLDKRVKAMPMHAPGERRLFYLHRALVLVYEGNYDGAISSARSDALKLNDGNELGILGIGLETLLSIEKCRGREYALMKIERVLGNEHDEENDE